MNDRQLLMKKIKSIVEENDTIPDTVIEFAESLDIFDLQSYLIGLNNSVKKASKLSDEQRIVLYETVNTFYNKATLIVNKFTKKLLNMAKLNEKVSQAKYNNDEDEDIFANISI